MERIISNCPLCFEHQLHVVENHDEGTMSQCMHCGYATSDKFRGPQGQVPEFDKLTPDMQRWAKHNKISNGEKTFEKYWIPSIMTLPDAMIFPVGEAHHPMKWALAKMVDIPEEEQKDYPIQGGGFYKQRYDTENQQVFDEFHEAIAAFEASIKQPEEKKIKLPKLTQM